MKLVAMSVFLLGYVGILLPYLMSHRSYELPILGIASVFGVYYLIKFILTRRN